MAEERNLKQEIGLLRAAEIELRTELHQLETEIAERRESQKVLSARIARLEEKRFSLETPRIEARARLDKLLASMDLRTLAREAKAYGLDLKVESTLNELEKELFP